MLWSVASDLCADSAQVLCRPLLPLKLPAKLERDSYGMQEELCKREKSKIMEVCSTVLDAHRLDAHR